VTFLSALTVGWMTYHKGSLRQQVEEETKGELANQGDLKNGR